MEPFSFFRAKQHAQTLPRAELRRHAMVSFENRHFCHECYTCACLEVLREKRSHDA